MAKQRRSKSEARRASDIVLDALRHRYGKDAATTTGVDRESSVRDFVSTQCFALDMALGRPGIPCGRLTVIQGKEASGKTTVVTHIMAECQRRGGLAVYIDAEYAFDSERAARMGLYDEDTLPARSDFLPVVIVHPEHVEDTLSKIEEVIARIREADEDILTVIAWDSVAGTPTKAEVEGTFEDSAQPGIHARKLSAGLRQLVKLIAHERIALVFVNQLKDAIGSFGFGGAQSTSIASKPLGYHASVRIETFYTGTVGGGKDKRKASTGITCRAKITKNKLAPPFREAEFIIDFNYGIDEEASRLQLASVLGIVGKRGSYLTFDGETFRPSKVPDAIRKGINAKLEEEAQSRRVIAPRGGVEDDETDESEED
ncbi:hypothetical protein LCGC14_1433460 [marine sediment metagenome]|uniref:RecA family profile 2 domain-containing protein n=1 Tax=marine sediment metagenome TaxID=412755 RepID=A0A0F9JMU6_9ZZZZ